MSALYSVLGVVAKMNSRMWLYRINFLPINVLLIGALAFGGFTTATNAIESLRNAKTPIDVSVAQIHVAPRLAQNYVSVSGLDFPFALYEFGNKSDNGEMTSVEKSWTPLLDTVTGRVLLVQRRGKMSGGDARQATVTGMLRELETDIRGKLAARRDTIQGQQVEYESRYMLIADERPANSMTSGLISVLLFAVLALFVIASARRNTIFQRAELGSPVSKMKTAESLVVTGTGTFVLEQSGKVAERRFIEMPAVLGHFDDGTPALFSNIDASSRFMGVTTSERKGIWTLAVTSGSVTNTDSGYVYWGTARRPAFRFSYVSPRGGKRQAIFSAPDVQTLSAAVALLNTTPAPRSAPAT